jgi:hypothetical protein
VVGVDVSPLGVDVSLASLQPLNLRGAFTALRGPTFALRLDMRTPRIILSLALSLSSAIGAAACALAPDTSDDPPRNTSANEGPATATAALREVGPDNTDGALDFGDLDLGGGLNFGGPPVAYGEGADQQTTLAECYAVARTGTTSREAFCRTVPDEKRGSCWSHVHDSPIAWTGWCTWNF